MKEKTPTLAHARDSLVVANNREFENDVLAGELAVDLAEGVNLVVNTSTLLGVEEDLDDLVAILLGADALANDLGRVDEVAKDSVVDGGKSPGARALLLDARAAAWLGKNAALSKEDNVAVRELLLELTGQTVKD